MCSPTSSRKRCKRRPSWPWRDDPTGSSSYAEIRLPRTRGGVRLPSGRVLPRCPRSAPAGSTCSPTRAPSFPVPGSPRRSSSLLARCTRMRGSSTANIMKILVSWSSGKDSAWMLHVLRCEGRGEPAGLLTTVNESANRVAMHAVRAEVLRAQADAAGLPLIVVPIPHPCPNAVYEAQMSAAIAEAKADGFTHVAFGDLFLEDIRRYREERMEGTGLTPIFPLWQRPTDILARQMLAGGLEAYLTCVDPRVLPPSMAGRRFDKTLLRDL